MTKLLREIVENTSPQKYILIDNEMIVDNILILNEYAAPVVKKQKSDMKNLHLDHIEDLVIRDGREGWDVISTVLKNTFKYIRSGKNERGFGVATKIDGSPSVVAGRHPTDGRFFVGSKSFFNKSPKVNYSNEDITTNHGASGGLARKLRHALEHLPKVTPATGVYQGDMIFSHNDKIEKGDGKISWQPNTLTYSHPLVDKDGKEDKEGMRIKNAKMGFAPHTEYEDIGNGEMRAKFNNPVSKFKRDHPDVYIMDPRLDGKKFELTPAKQKQFRKYLQDASVLHREISKSNGYHLIRDHEALLLAYINSGVADGRKANPAGYASFVEGKYKDRAQKLKLSNSKSRVKAELDYALNDLMQSKQTLTKLFALHDCITKAKNILVDALSKGSKYEHSYMGQPSKAEGFVANHEGRAVKLVDRQHFSAANFEWNSKVNPEDKPMVISWGRMNPPHAGHEKMIEKGEALAKKTGAKHQVIATRSQDKENNPLSPQDKLKHLKTMFPGKNIALAAPDATTLMAQLTALNMQGVKDITIVCGPERRATYQNLLTNYNGAGKPFHFSRIRVVAAGQRADDAKGAEGVSGTKQREAAKKGDLKSFKQGMPKTASGQHAHKLFADLRKAMGVLQMDPVKKKKPTLGQTIQAAIKEKA